MRKILLAISFLIFFSSLLSAQIPKSVITEREMIWFGLDFSKMRMINTGSDPEKIKDKYFKAWNDLILKEKKKYDLKKYFSKDIVKHDLETGKERNKLPDPKEMEIYDDYRLEESNIQSMIKEYNSKFEKGLGLVFIIESFNKDERKGFMWITFFDIASNDVLYTKRMDGKTGGIGIRNFWARSIHNVLKDCKGHFELDQLDNDN